jgi:hypothetical protein
MINKLINTTDTFLCNNLKNIVKKAEEKCFLKGIRPNVLKELSKIDENLLVSRGAKTTDFEKRVKLDIKILLGIFFVVVPLFGFSLLSFILSIEYSYVFILTFAVAIFSTLRMENIVKKYTQLKRLNT